MFEGEGGNWLTLGIFLVFELLILLLLFFEGRYRSLSPSFSFVISFFLKKKMTHTLC
jgi:hypothetical protein